MLLVSAFRNLDRKDVVKRSTQRWRSFVMSLETSNIFRLELIQWLCLLRNMLLVSAFRHLGNKDIAKRSAEDGVPWRVIGNEQHIPI